METFGWTDHFCSLPVVPADTGPRLPMLHVAFCPGRPGCGCRVGQSQLFCWKCPVLSLQSLMLFLRAVSHIPVFLCRVLRSTGAWRWEAGKSAVQGWDAMLDLGSATASQACVQFCWVLGVRTALLYLCSCHGCKSVLPLALS